MYLVTAMRKTTIVIDENLIKEAMELVDAKTKKKAIEMGLKELIKSKQREALRKELGTYELELNYNELMKLRDED
jgi:Arc/MetJ family transcription regulator